MIEEKETNKEIAMKLILSLALLAFALLATVPAGAQTVINLDINKASLAWQWTQGIGGVAAEFHVKCGPASGSYSLPIVKIPAPVLTVPIKSVTPAVGKYFCVVTAANQYGESAPSNEVAYDAGTVPAAPTAATIQSQ